ncbi:hypothetical protein UlMin_022082 [Ulmus minor]
MVPPYLTSSFSHHEFKEDQSELHNREAQQFQKVHEKEVEKVVVSCGRSCDQPKSDQNEIAESSLKLSIDLNYEYQTYDENQQSENNSSAMWMPSKMRMMKKMMNRDQTSTETTENFAQKFETKKLCLASPLGADDHSSNSSSNMNNNNNINNTIRVCADCNTTKTPLWRSGPRGPKSLCNACGIRQRKARRAMAIANGTILAVDTKEGMKSKGQHKHKDKKSRISNGCDPQFKKKGKLATTTPSRGRPKKLCFEDLTISMTEKYSSFQRVFPQDEREAAILLMALSYGLVHG